MQKKMPLKYHENILVFYKKLPPYHPQKTRGHNPVHNYIKHSSDGSNYGKTKTDISGGGSTERFPRDVLKFKWDTQQSKFHPTQKPIEVLKYMINTYTNENDLVLDVCAGSMSTAIACGMTNRNCICIEKDKLFFENGLQRINEYLQIKESEVEK